MISLGFLYLHPNTRHDEKDDNPDCKHNHSKIYRFISNTPSCNRTVYQQPMQKPKLKVKLKLCMVIVESLFQT